MDWQEQTEEKNLAMAPLVVVVVVGTGNKRIKRLNKYKMGRTIYVLMRQIFVDGFSLFFNVQPTGTDEELYIAPKLTIEERINTFVTNLNSF